MPGVLAVLTGADVKAAGLKDVPHTPIPSKPPADILLPNRDGSEHGYAPQELLPTDRVRYVGQQVAMVVAETLAQAKDAAERIVVDYETLDQISATPAAAQSGVPRLYDHVGNICIDADIGDVEATKAAFARAAQVAKFESWVHRVTGVPLDARAAVGVYDKATNKHTLHAGSGGVVRQKHELAHILGVEQRDVRVECGDVGGNYGTRNAFYPEFALVVWAAKQLGRPVKWTCERSEAFASDYQGRDQAITLELAMDERGKFLALRGSVVCNTGAHSVMYVPLVKCAELLSSIYRIPVAHIRARAALTNTPPTNPYRSAGRPEAIYAIERLVDVAAKEFGYDRIDLRRRNIIPPKAQPYANPLGMTYDCGDYAKVMDRALTLSDWKDFKKRRRESKKNGKLRGIGLANYLEITSGSPREWSKVDVKPEGRVEVSIGTLSSGQGHETSFAQCVGEWLGVDVECISLIQGDTDIIPIGGGSHSARSMRMGGVVMGKASQAVIQKATKIAGHVLETDAADVGLRRRPLHRARHRPLDRAVRGGAGGARAQRPAGGSARAARGRLRGVHPDGGVPVRLRGLRGRDRPRHRPRRDRALHRDRRCRPRHQPAHSSRPDPRRHRPGRRPGAVGAFLLRRRDRAASGRLDDGLRHAARPHDAVVHLGTERNAGAGQSARRARRRRRRHHPCARRGGQRRGGCAIGLRRDAYRDAGDGGEGVARDTRRQSFEALGNRSHG